ncbi:MAG: hypothetical protein AB6733_00270 [Clostridiaceae bacterium]
MAITSLNEIKAKAAIEVVLPGWDNDPFICKLRRVGLMELVANGKIPNPLMETVTELFEGKLNKDDVKTSEDKYKRMYEGLNFFCKAAMVEPTFEEVEEIMSLTDNQRFMIYKFATDGVMMITPSTEE